MEKYHYTESGLDNVFLEGLVPAKDAKGNITYEIKGIYGLHLKIASGLVRKPVNLSGQELRFLRTELGYTQAELGLKIQREPLTISRWERNEQPIDANAEAIIRLLAHDELKIDETLDVKDVLKWTVASSKTPQLIMDVENPQEVQYKWAA